jgi:hypothetical protein
MFISTTSSINVKIICLYKTTCEGFQPILCVLIKQCHSFLRIIWKSDEAFVNLQVSKCSSIFLTEIHSDRIKAENEVSKAVPICWVVCFICCAN